MRRDAFAGYHPAVNFIYLASVITMTLLLSHPVWILASLTGAVSYAVFLGGRKALRFMLLFALPIALLTAILNPLFVHQGGTILFYLKENPVTLEAVIYGMTRGVMFGACLIWFYCYNHLMTSDKFLYLFGRILPAGSLIFSMVLGFLPRFTLRLKKISDAQRFLQPPNEKEGLKDKVKRGGRVLSIMTTWSLENALDTSDSMKSRGYGLPDRSQYTSFAGRGRDGAAGALLFLLVAFAVSGMASGISRFSCYPMMETRPFDAASLGFAGMYLLLCWGPFLLNMMEEWKWMHMKSGI